MEREVIKKKVKKNTESANLVESDYIKRVWKFLLLIIMISEFLYRFLLNSKIPKEKKWDHSWIYQLIHL